MLIAVEQQVTSFQVLTLIIAIAGLALSLTALVWQIVSWLYTGSRVKVALSEAVILTPRGSMDVYAIMARNVGRTAVSITGWGLLLVPNRPSGSVLRRMASNYRPRGNMIVVPNPVPWQGPRSPYTLDGQHSATWYVLKNDIAQEIDDDDRERRHLRGYVNLATGKSPVSRSRIDLLEQQ
jgi:hypothetical protein